MTPAKLVVVTTVGLLASACSYSNTTTRTTVPVTATVYPVTSEQACQEYGFRVGTDAYNRCVIREAEARARGRMPVTYTVVALTTDAQAACSSYGLVSGTATYDRCVSREVEARRYRQEATVTTYPAPVAPVATTTTYSPNAYTTVYTTTTPTTTIVPAATTPPAGVQAFRDEYGFRYDGQGNRVDAQGNIISPASTRP